MAEGEDWNEMDDLSERFPEYDNLSTEDLDTSLNELRERLLNDDDPLVTEKITYINNLLSERRVAETDFGGDLLPSSVRTDVFAQIDKYVQDSRGGRLDPYAESVLELRRRTTIKDGKVMFKAKT